VESLAVHQSKGRLLGLLANFKKGWKNYGLFCPSVIDKESKSIMLAPEG